MSDQNKQLKDFAVLSGLGFQMLAIIGLSTFLGLKLDAFCSNSTTNYYTLGLIFFGVILATLHVVRRIIKHKNMP